MAVKDNFLVAGGFHGELICKVSFMESVLPTKGNFAMLACLAFAREGHVYVYHSLCIQSK
jgi:hypothetical protein